MPNGGPPAWTGILLPDGVWYEVDPQTLEVATFAGNISGYRWETAGVEYRIPATSAVAARVAP
jgi:hypothetical protein